MDLKNLDPSEQETAVQLFKAGLKSLADDLENANVNYKVALNALKEIGAKRRQVADKYNTIISLIRKAGGQIDEQEAELADIESAPSYSEIANKDDVPKISEELESVESKPRPIIRNEVLEVLRATNKFQTANDVLSLVRKKLGDSIPDSTVTSSLSVQYKAGIVKRFSASNGTSLYGLPEWFLDGKPRREFTDNTQMLIIN
ncbi:MAG: hypothetical protein ACRYFZ_07480 [Janthinobacterium lividum]